MTDTPPPTPTPATPPPPPPTGQPADPGRTYTEAELNEKINAHDQKATNKATAAARKAIAEELGMSVDDASMLIKANEEAEQAKKDDVVKATEAAAAATEAAAVAQEQARQATLRADLQLALGVPGEGDDAPAINPAYLAPAINLGMPVALAYEGDDPAEAIAAAVAHVRATASPFFGSSNGEPAPPPAPSAPGTPSRPAGQRDTKVTEGKPDPAKAILAHQQRRRDGLPKLDELQK